MRYLRKSFFFLVNTYKIVYLCCKKKLKQTCKILSVIVTASLFYIYVHFTYIPLSTEDLPLKQMEYKTVNEKFLIDTPGCTIPNYARKFKYNETSTEATCSERAIYIEKPSEHEIKFIMYHKKFRKYKSHWSYRCCYSFASRSTEPGLEDTNITYTDCEKFTSGTRILQLHEVVTVTCNFNRGKNVFYRDAYMLVKKKRYVVKQSKGKPKWNVLILGVDTMSRTRVYTAMPTTTKYFNENRWLDFRGYHKVGSNTYPNLMAFMSGLNESILHNNDNLAREKIIWNTFKKYGYMTAYGEDYLKCPDTFKTHGGFKTQPTDHYMRPLFLTGEIPNNQVLCTQKLSSGRHVLNYAYDFANTYKKGSFFGLFWINSFSHDVPQNPLHIEYHLKEFFEKLNDAGILKTTVIVFLSDHGKRFGKMRYQVESYYDNRLPMLFMWIPPLFRDLYSSEYANAIINQHRLVTPYDLHATLLHILKFSNNSVKEWKQTENPHSLSILEEHSVERTCAVASISDKWCSCHSLLESNQMTHEANKSIQLMETSIKNSIGAIKTQNCTRCSEVQIQSVLRMHTYTKGDTEFSVIAMRISPIDLYYEGVVTKNLSSNVYEVLEEADIIMNMNKNNTKKGWCTRPRINKMQCKCVTDSECLTARLLGTNLTRSNLVHVSMNSSIIPE